jgi:hypothetical protein
MTVYGPGDRRARRRDGSPFYAAPREGYCQCETPIFDDTRDAACRRCALPIDFTPAAPAGESDGEPDA